MTARRYETILNLHVTSDMAAGCTPLAFGLWPGRSAFRPWTRLLFPSLPE